MRTILKIVAIYLGLSFILVLIWTVFSYPNIATDPVEWLWLFALAIPIQMAGEFAGQLFFNNRFTRALELRTAGQRFSWLRVGFGLVMIPAALFAIAVLAHAWAILKPMIDWR